MAFYDELLSALGLDAQGAIIPGMGMVSPIKKRDQPAPAEAKLRTRPDSQHDQQQEDLMSGRLSDPWGESKDRTAYIDEGHNTKWAPNREMARQLAKMAFERRQGQGSTEAADPMVGGEEQHIPTTVHMGEPKKAVPRPESGASHGEKVALKAAFDRVGESSQGQQGEPLTNTDDPHQDTGDEQLSMNRKPLGTRRESEPSSGSGSGAGVLSRLAAQMSTGATGEQAQDPRTADLRRALAKRGRLLTLADGLDTMASGADIAGGTHFNTPGAAGRGAREQAQNAVDQAKEPVEYEQKNKKHDSDMATDDQTRRLRDSGETRAQSAEGRAVSKEGRESKSFDTAQAEFDSSSQTSQNARAEAEAIYPQVTKKFPPGTWEKFSANDVKRMFGEVQLKDFQPKGAGKSSKDEARRSNSMRQLMTKNPDAFHTEYQARSIDKLAEELGGWDNAMVGVAKGAVPNQVISPKEQEFRQRISEMIADYRHGIYGSALTATEQSEADETATRVKAGQPAPRVANSVRLIRERNKHHMNQTMTGQPQETIDTVRDAFDHPDKYDVFSGESRSSGGGGSSRVWVSNGKQRTQIDPSDLEAAKRDGYHQVAAP